MLFYGVSLDADDLEALTRLSNLKKVAFTPELVDALHRANLEALSISSCRLPSNILNATLSLQKLMLVSCSFPETIDQDELSLDELRSLTVRQPNGAPLDGDKLLWIERTSVLENLDLWRVQLSDHLVNVILMLDIAHVRLVNLTDCTFSSHESQNIKAALDKKFHDKVHIN